MQHDLAKLKNVIASALAQVKAYDLPKTCSDLDLSPGDGSEAFASKRKYVEKRIGHFSHQELVRLAHRVLQIVPDYYLEEEIWCLESPIPAVSELTRRKLLKELYKESDLT